MTETDSIEHLSFLLTEAEGAYLADSSAANYNELRRFSKLLAHKLLVRKALEGSTMAAVELAKRNPLNPDFDALDVEQLKECRDVSLEFLQAAEKQTQLCKEKFGTENAQEIIELWKAGKIGHDECEKMLQILGRKQQLELAAKDTGSGVQIFLHPSHKLDDAI